MLAGSRQTSTNEEHCVSRQEQAAFSYQTSLLYSRYSFLLAGMLAAKNAAILLMKSSVAAWGTFTHRSAPSSCDRAVMCSNATPCSMVRDTQPLLPGLQPPGVMISPAPQVQSYTMTCPEHNVLCQHQYLPEPLATVAALMMDSLCFCSTQTALWHYNCALMALASGVCY